MEIEYDPIKNQANIRKHGLCFEDVAGLDWDNAIYIEDSRKDYGEARMKAYVRDSDGKPFSVIFTLREDKLRIISFRRAREKERNDYV